MIKIIKQGNPNRKVKLIYTKECLICGCQFEYESVDIEKNLYGDSSIECPCCKRHLGISGKEKYDYYETYNRLEENNNAKEKH